jgi:hypothetical protein
MMEDIAVLNKSGIIPDVDLPTNYYRTRFTPEKSHNNPVIDSLIAEGGENLLNYIKWHRLANEPRMLVLSSNHHYYYEEKELKDVKVLINLKKLNLIKNLDKFLNTLVRILPTNANFIGCFSDKNAHKENEFSFIHRLRLFNSFINFLDSKTDHNMNQTEVSEILKRNGFKTLDMKEMNGLTYFYCKSSGNIFN